MQGIGRLRDGVTLEAAQDEMDGLSLYLQETFADWSPGGARLDTRFSSSDSTLGAMMRLLMAAVVAVLLVELHPQTGLGFDQSLPD